MQISATLNGSILYFLISGIVARTMISVIIFQRVIEINKVSIFIYLHKAKRKTKKSNKKPHYGEWGVLVHREKLSEPPALVSITLKNPVGSGIILN